MICYRILYEWKKVLTPWMSDVLLFRIFSSVIIKFPMVQWGKKTNVFNFINLTRLGSRVNDNFCANFYIHLRNTKKKETVLASKQTWMYVTKKEKQSCCVCAIKHPASANSNDSAQYFHWVFIRLNYVWIIIISV